MSEDDFAACSPQYFRLRLHGMRLAQQQKFRNEWEIARWQTATMMAPHLKKPISPQKLLKFPWEQAVGDDIVAAVAKYKDIFAKLTPPPQA